MAERELERTLWATADKLRSNMDAAEYKHVVLGLIFLKYISDAFDELYQRLKAREPEGYNPEDKDEYLAENVFWAPPAARWTAIQAKNRQAHQARKRFDRLEREGIGAGPAPGEHQAGAADVWVSAG